MSLVNLAPALFILVAASVPPTPQTVTFEPEARAVSTWRQEASDNLVLSAEQRDAMRDTASAALVARCVKLNNYWCVKRAGWNGELGADGEGHVAFATATQGAAVAALLLKRYYVDFGRKTALAIVSHWAPARCGIAAGRAAATAPSRASGTSPLGRTLRARWLAGHTRGFITTIDGRRTPSPRRSTVRGPIDRKMQTPTIARGLAIPTGPMTFDALLRASPNAPPSRSMIGMPFKRSVTDRPTASLSLGASTDCGSDSVRLANYAEKATVGIAASNDGDLGLFTTDGAPTANLALMMENMARVEIGPFAVASRLIATGIADAFTPGRNPVKP